MALNKQQRYQAQMGLLDAHGSELYLTLMAERARKASLFFSCITAISALAAATFAGLLWDSQQVSVVHVGGLVAGSVAGVASIVGIVLDFSKRATKASALAKECAQLAAEWRTLVISSNGFDHNNLEQLSKRQKEVEAPVSGEIPYNRKVNKRAQEAAKVRVAHEIHQKSLEELTSEQREGKQRAKNSKATATDST